MSKVVSKKAERGKTTTHPPQETVKRLVASVPDHEEGRGRIAVLLKSLAEELLRASPPQSFVAYIADTRGRQWNHAILWDLFKELVTRGTDYPGAVALILYELAYVIEAWAVPKVNEAL
jgi:hypothetical protein